MTTDTSQWYMIEPMNDMPVYSFVCPDCVNSVIKFLSEEEISPKEKVDPITQCCVCGRQL